MTKYDLYKNFSENIEKERYRLGLSQQKMADALGISLSKYKIIISNPAESNVDMFLAHKIQKLTGKTARELCDDDIPELQMLKWFRELPKHRQEAIKYIIEIEHQLPHDSAHNIDECGSNCPARSTDHANVASCSKNIDGDCVTCFVPTGNMADGMILDSRDFLTINIAEYKKNCCERIDCGVKITSNHLHPIYAKGDILLVSKRAPRDGDIGIFIYKETRQIFIREFKQTQPCELRPINDYGRILYVDSNDPSDMAKWIKFGTVVTTMR